VVAMPNVTSAICVSSKCTCFDGEYKLEMTDKECETWSIERPFNPYQPRPTLANQNQAMQASPPTPNPQEVLSMRSPLPL